MESLSIRRVPLAELLPDPANARAHGEKNLEAIRASLARFGQAEPLVVQRATKRVIGGHGRLAAMKALGWKEADIVELELDDLQATALGIALNRTGELAEWDLPALSKILESLQVQGALDGVGFSEKEISGILDDVIAAGENLDGILQDDVPLPPDAATTRTGDLWILGNHRLLCGDSSKREDLDRLLAGAKIQLVNSDSPYNGMRPTIPGDRCPSAAGWKRRHRPVAGDVVFREAPRAHLVELRVDCPRFSLDHPPASARARNPTRLLATIPDPR